MARPGRRHRARQGRKGTEGARPSSINTLEHALDLCDELDAGKERLLAYHVCDWLTPTRDLLSDRGMMGDGVVELKKIRGWVGAAGFAGYSEVEIFSNLDWWQRPGDETLDACIERHKSAV